MGLANALLAGSGVVVAVLGFWLLSTGSISAAPAILILAYLVLIPVGLALPRRREEPSQKRDAG
jgi:pheromone shutdown protein TraB